MLDGPVEQIIDSTPMLGAAATQETVRLVRHGVRKLLDAVTAVDEDAAGRLDDGLEFGYDRPGEKPGCRWPREGRARADADARRRRRRAGAAGRPTGARAARLRGRRRCASAV